MDPMVGQIILFGGNFAPRGWAFCNGQTYDVSAHEALFAILGTTYGGDGMSTFCLPDLRGRVPIHAGQGSGLSPRKLGQTIGAEAVALNVTHLPEDRRWTETGITPPDAAHGTQNTPRIGGRTTGKTDGIAHENIQPSLCLNYIIAVEGHFPLRSQTNRRGLCHFVQ